MAEKPTKGANVEKPGIEILSDSEYGVSMAPNTLGETAELDSCTINVACCCCIGSGSAQIKSEKDIVL